MSLNPEQLITAPDVEAGARQALAAHLSVPVSVEWPRSLPSSFVVVSVAGGEPSSNLVLGVASLLVECYAGSTVAASQLARRALARLSNTAHDWGGVSVARVQSTWPVYYPDPRTENHARYQFTAQAVIHMEVTSWP